MATTEKMPIEERYQYLRRMQKFYRQANRKEKKELLDQMEMHTGLHRKSLIRHMNSSLQRKPRRRERGNEYGPEVDEALLVIRESFDYICPERYQPKLLERARALARHGELRLGPQLAADLGRISISTIRRHLPPSPLVHRRRKPTAPPNRHQQEIPAYRIERDIDEPGHFELDLVHHAGGSSEGQYVHTLQLIDVATGWSGRRAILGRSSLVVVDALTELFSEIPFAIRELHPDNGSEFLNDILERFMREKHPHVLLSRSRRGQPNDNRLVEQKNHTLVRYFLGDRRFNTVKQTRYLNTLYAQLAVFYNVYQPVMKQIDKMWMPATEERAAYLKRIHDQPRSPLSRLCELYKFVPPRLQPWIEHRYGTNPLQLRREIYAGLDHLFAYPNADPDQVEDVYQTLAHPDLFPAAQVALQAVDTGDKPQPGLPPVPTASTTTTSSSLRRKEEATLG
jgi:hypothetical protein